MIYMFYYIHNVAMNKVVNNRLNCIKTIDYYSKAGIVNYIYMWMVQNKAYAVQILYIAVAMNFSMCVIT